MPEIKQTILSNVRNALTNNQQTPQEKIQENLLSSIVFNLRNLFKQGLRKERKQEKIITSINSNIRTISKQSLKKEKGNSDKFFDKHFSSVKEILIKIKKNTHPDGSGFGILKFLLFMFAGVLIKTVTSMWKAFKFILTPFKWFGKAVEKLSNVIIKLGLLLKKGFIGLIVNPFKKLWKSFTIISESGRSGAKQLTKFGMAIEKFKFKFGNFFIGIKNSLNKSGLVLKKSFSLITTNFGMAIEKLKIGGKKFFNIGINVFEKTIMSLKNIKVGGIFSAIGNFLKRFKFLFKMLAPFKMLLAPLRGIVGKILFPIIALFDIFTGLSKAGKWFGKKKGESTTLKEKVSAVLGQLVSTFSFGLLSGEEMAKGFHKLFTKPSEFFKEDFPKLMKSAGTNLISGLKKVGGWIYKGVIYLIKLIGSVDWIGVIKTVGDIIVKGISKGIELWKTYFPILWSKIIDIIKSINWVKIGEILMTVVSTLTKILWAVVKEIPSVLWTILKTLAPLLLVTISSVGKLIWGVLQGIGDLVLEWGKGVLKSIWDSITNIFSLEDEEGKSTLLSSIVKWGKGIITSIWEGIKNIFSSEDDVGDTSIIDNAMNALSGLSDNVVSGVKDFVISIVDGIGGALKLFKNLGTKIIDKIVDFYTVKDNKNNFNYTNAYTVPTANINEQSNKVTSIPKATVKEIKNVDDINNKNNISINDTSSVDEKQKTMMEFLLNQFSDIMAKKIGLTINKRGESYINTPIVRVF